MGYTLDYFVGELLCPRCGQLSAASDSTNMATAMRNEPQLAWLKVGDALEVDHSTMGESGYLVVQSPSEPTRILQSWACPGCGCHPNWAEVVVRDGHIESMTAAPLEMETLGRIHYIDEFAYHVAVALSGRDYREIAMGQVVPLLRELLKHPHPVRVTEADGKRNS